MPRECPNKRSERNKVLPYPLPRDKTSSFIPYCSYEKHPGILDPSVYRKCARRRCFYLHLFRPEGAEETPRKPRVYKDLREIDITIRFL